MKWLRKLSPVDPGKLEGADARIRAEEALEATMADTPRYERLASEINRERHINGLSELIYQIHVPKKGHA